jgi:3-phosphoshikimate 1-carboxyvinyltransferase
VQAKILPSTVSGTLLAPASKSSMQRACAAALLHNGVTILNNAGISNDDKAALDIITQLGAKIDKSDSQIEIISQGFFANNNISANINCAESGLSIRMFTPIAALSANTINVTGSGSLTTRPMNFFDEIFPLLHINILSNNGKLPIQINGPLQPNDITIDGSLSSQFLTGLLFAYGEAVTKKAIITVTNLKSKPYIDLTLFVMKHFGYNIEHKNYEQFIIHPKLNTNNKQINFTVEGDWSGAAFLLVAGAIAGNVAIQGLDVFSTQADKKILDALRDCGCSLSVQEKQIEVSTPLSLKPFHFNATDCPDLFPPLVALAAYCNGTSVIEGVGRLAHKESNRAITLQQEFAKMGIEITLQNDLMMIKGGEGLQGAIVTSHHDHRIAMACAVAALKANGNTLIEHADAINKSYPNFFEHLQMLNVALSLTN